MNDTEQLRRRITEALRSVRSPSAGADVIEARLIRNLEVDDRGGVDLSLVLPAEDPAGLATEVQRAVDGVEGVRSVRLSLGTVGPEAAEAESGAERERADGSRNAAGPRRGSGRELPVMGEAAAGPGAGARGAPDGGAPPGGPRPRGPGHPDREAASRHPSEAPPLEGVRHVVAVSSGKGGVGKSTVSTNLAASLARAGHAVGLLDADIYGPDIPTMFGVHGRPGMREERVVPLEGHGVKLMSIGFLVEEDTPAIWRGPIIMGVVRQFLKQVEWGALDYLVVDLPPGTGDAQLSLCQLVQLDGAVMVTTPQDVAVGGVLKGIRMFQKLDVPVLGVVENMRGFACPDCGATHDIFGSGGGEKLAAALDVPFLGAVPLGMAVREEGDRGTPTVVGRPDAPEARAFEAVALAVAEGLEDRAAVPS